MTDLQMRQRVVCGCQLIKIMFNIIIMVSGKEGRDIHPKSQGELIKRLAQKSYDEKIKKFVREEICRK